ncbi:MAG: hint module-domain-containing protein [Monoraphidium minutum]|nr:MAG: hint module-domain-containing protein [Monoraphidium minutum]
MCSDRAAACFPGDATVALRGGATKAMRDLAVGDSILVLKADGSAAFEDVYFFDHQVDGGSHSFVKLNLADGSSLELTSGHFVPVGESLAAAVMKRAGAVAEGEPLLVMSGGGAEAVIVASIEAITKPGLFAPVTASGTLVVGGVVASAYSDWVLDPLFDALGATASLPAAMHAVHAPLRLAYSILGARAMAALSPLVSGIAMLDTAQIAAGLGLSVSA